MKRTNQSGQAAKRAKQSKGFSGKSAPVYTRAPKIAGEMKYFDTYKTTTAVGVVTTTWPAGAMVDPTTTVNLGAAAVATPLCLFAPTVGSALNQRIGQIHGQITAAATGQSSQHGSRTFSEGTSDGRTRPADQWCSDDCCSAHE